MPKLNTSWGRVAGWYDDYLENDPDNYQQKIILPNLLRLLDLKGGEKVLDLACGSGFFSRALVAAGAQVLGVDISSELIKLAGEKPKANLQYKILSADKLVGVLDQSFDKVICVLAIQNIREVKKVFGEAKRVLKPSGQFLLVLNHPAFRIPQASHWGWDDVSQSQYRRLDRYLTESQSDIIMNPGESVSRQIKTLSFHRPLQYYFKLLGATGFSVTRLEEWISHKKSMSGPRARAEDRARHEFPLFLCLETKLV